MNKLFFALFFLTALVLSLTFILKVIYFPVDVLNLFPSYHTEASLIPHNTLVSDSVFQFEPWRHFVKETIFSGVFPLWNNLNAGGVPLFANAQSAILFPINFVYYIFPPSVSLNLIPVLKLNFLFLFTFLYLRSIRISNAVSLLGGITVCFSGFSLVWLLWPHTNVYIFLPLFLYLTEKIRSGKGEKKWYVLLSVSYCLAIFGGHYETLLHMMLLHLPYAFFRFQLDRRKFFVFMVFVILGVLLSAVQIVPFLEYFLNSSAFAYRTHSAYLYLPVQSAVLNILPFLSGAPHLTHYRPIVTVTNFQESMGGYTGVIVVLTAFAGVVTLIRKISLVKLWSVLTVIFWLLAFKIWPIGLFLELPLISQVQNSRLSALAGFSTIILFAITIEKIAFIVGKRKKILPITFGVVTLVLLIGVLCIEVLSITTKLNIFRHPYITQLNAHIIFISFTTLLFVPALYFVKKFKFYIFLIAILIGSQTLYLLAGYIPLLNASSYYPHSPVVEKLQNLPKGTVLEVGNPSLPPDINLMYGISLAQNYDGIEIKEYKGAFDEAFLLVNQWGKVENVSLESLQKFNISYVLSDYNINYVRQKVQPIFTAIIGPITSSYPTKIEFTPEFTKLSEIRFLPANYNRNNTCVLEVEIIERETNTRIYQGKINCKNLLDKMYFTLETSGVVLIPQKKYTFAITSEETNLQNSVGIWGTNGVPFVELYFNQKPQSYNMLHEGNNIKLFKVPQPNVVRINGNYKILRDTSNELQFSYESTKESVGEVKKAFYPGWEAYIDGKKVSITNAKPFMKIEFPKGKHIVSIQYNPLSFKLGITISLVSLIVLFCIAKLKKLT